MTGNGQHPPPPQGPGQPRGHPRALGRPRVTAPQPQQPPPGAPVIPPQRRRGSVQPPPAAPAPAGRRTGSVPARLRRGRCIPRRGSRTGRRPMGSSSRWAGPMGRHSRGPWHPAAASSPASAHAAGAVGDRRRQEEVGHGGGRHPRQRVRRRWRRCSCCSSIARRCSRARPGPTRPRRSRIPLLHLRRPGRRPRRSRGARPARVRAHGDAVRRARDAHPGHGQHEHEEQHPLPGRRRCPGWPARRATLSIFSHSQLKALILKTGRCMDRAWGPIMQRQGIRFTPPSYSIVATRGRGACGDYPSPGSMVPYYCPRNNTIYASTSAMARGNGNARGYGPDPLLARRHHQHDGPRVRAPRAEHHRADGLLVDADGRLQQPERQAGAEQKTGAPGDLLRRHVDAVGGRSYPVNTARTGPASSGSTARWATTPVIPATTAPEEQQPVVPAGLGEEPGIPVQHLDGGLVDDVLMSRRVHLRLGTCL